MKTRGMEWMKTILLSGLVVLSFILTGLLWYSSPSYEDKGIPGYVPPYVLDEKYNQKQPFQFVSPSQIIVHHAGKHVLIRPENINDPPLIKVLREADFVKVNEIEPTAKEWNTLFHQATGIEFQYLRDVSVNFLDAFFKVKLSEQPYFDQLSKVSRVWAYQSPELGRYLIWFISDTDQKVVQVQVELKSDYLSGLLMQASQSSSVDLQAYPADGILPWDIKKQSSAFSRILYIPSSPPALSREIYQIDQIPIDWMNQWLFRDPVKHSIPLNTNEMLYLFSGQLLTYNRSENYMVYEDSKTRPYQEAIPLEDQLRKMVDFIQRHRGWAGPYLLDKVQEETHYPEYHFRLIIEGLPVYWRSDRNIHLDVIQMQTGLNLNGTNGIRKYARSLDFFLERPKKESIILPGKDQLWSRIEKQKIDLKRVERIFIGYQAQNLSKGKQVLLEPTWFVSIQGKSMPVPVQ